MMMVKGKMGKGVEEKERDLSNGKLCRDEKLAIECFMGAKSLCIYKTDI